jgi:hypothetical protein
MGLMQIAVHYYVGQPPWLPEGQWCDLDKLAVTVVDVGSEALFAEWQRDLLLERPLTLKKRQHAEKRLAWHLANRGVPERFDKTRH